MAASCRIDASGITAPDYPAVLRHFQDSYRAIYGQDVYLEPDSQDGAFLAILALAQHDTNSATIAAYNAFSPATAQGEGLSRVVAINGIARAVPSTSRADVEITGSAGTQIVAGSVLDPAGGRWFLANSVTIGPSGVAYETVRFERPGAVVAPAGTLKVIGSPTRGWQTVSNPLAAVPGAPVEGDAALRRRQEVSTALPSRTVLDGIAGGLLSLPGVIRLNLAENDTSATDARGLAANSIAAVVEGGDQAAIGRLLLAKKSPGVATAGAISQTLPDIYGNARPVRFSRPVPVTIEVQVTLTALPGYTTATGEAIKAAVAAYVSAQSIGGVIRRTRIFVPVQAVGVTFSVTGLTFNRAGSGAVSGDIALAYTEAAVCAPANVAVTTVAG